MIPTGDGKSSRKVQNTGMKGWGDIKFFLRDIAISKLVELYEGQIHKNISNVNTPE